MKRNDEELCKQRFHKYISNIFPSEKIRWEEVPPEEEPPDFYLHLDGTKYAVEVTGIVEKIDVGTGNTIPRNIAYAILIAFVHKIAKEAKENGLLSGAYTVRFHQIIKNFRTVESGLREQMLYYIRMTKELESAEAIDFFMDYERICSIKKDDNRKDVIYPSLPGSAKWEGQSTKDSKILLEERIFDKVKKLRNLTSPIILLILDTNGYFPNNTAFIEAIPLIPEISQFHTVFVVSPNFGDFLLCSENSEW